MSTSTTPDQPAPRQVIFDTGDHGALYADGLLVTTGTASEVTRKALELAGVDLRTGDDFLLGHAAKSARDVKAKAAPTMEAIEGFITVRDQVADLRSRAAALEAEAAELEASLTDSQTTAATVGSDPDPLGLDTGNDDGTSPEAATETFETAEEQQ